MAARVGIVMGSRSDWPTMQRAAEMLARLGVEHEVRVVSAHRTPDLLFDYAQTAEGRGLRAIIAGAGGVTDASAPLPRCTSIFSVPQLFGSNQRVR